MVDVKTVRIKILAHGGDFCIKTYENRKASEESDEDSTTRRMEQSCCNPEGPETSTDTLRCKLMIDHKAGVHVLANQKNVDRAQVELVKEREGREPFLGWVHARIKLDEHEESVCCLTTRQRF